MSCVNTHNNVASKPTIVMRAKSANKDSAMVEASCFFRIKSCFMKVISVVGWKMVEVERFQPADTSTMANGRMEKDIYGGLDFLRHGFGSYHGTENQRYEGFWYMN